jgi:hypothetical protein
MSEASHRISVCYFPGTGEVELTWEDISTGKQAALTTTVSEVEGVQLSECVSACVYHDATVVNAAQKSIAEIFELIENGVLVRNTDGDHDMKHFVDQGLLITSTLQRAKAAMESP